MGFKVSHVTVDVFPETRWKQDTGPTFYSGHQEIACW